jgi:hypothetical protein
MEIGSSQTGKARTCRPAIACCMMRGHQQHRQKRKSERRMENSISNESRRPIRLILKFYETN